MNHTIAELLDWLELPENDGQIQHLVHFKNIEHLGALKNMRGFGGIISRIVMHVVRNHIGAFMALAECQSVADIAAFKNSEHFNKIKDVQADWGTDLEQLKELEELKELETEFGRSNEK